MENIILKPQTGNTGCIEEKIYLSAYKTAAALKNGIRKLSGKYRQKGWYVTNILRNCFVITLIFKKK